MTYTAKFLVLDHIIRFPLESPFRFLYLEPCLGGVNVVILGNNLMSCFDFVYTDLERLIEFIGPDVELMKVITIMRRYDHKNINRYTGDVCFYDSMVDLSCIEDLMNGLPIPIILH